MLICFPEKNYSNYAKVKLAEFDFSAMLLTILNRYCLQLVLSEIFDFKFELGQSYKYKFSEFELTSLGKKSEDELIKKKVLCVPYNFILSTFGQKYRGEIFIKIEFINKGTFENSFYDIYLEVRPNNSLRISPFFLNETAFIMHISEFMQKMWKPIWVELSVVGDLKKSMLSEYNLGSEVEIFSTDIFDMIKLPSEISDLVCDVFCIASALWLKYSSSSWIMLSADDVLNQRGLEKNLNLNGKKYGYKAVARNKIHAALNILNITGVLVVREFGEYNYAISVPYNLRGSKRYKVPIKLFKYKYKTELWKKRIGLYLRINKPFKIKVEHVLDLVQNLCMSYKPLQCRDKLEETLDMLVYEAILDDWCYEEIDENSMQGKAWFNNWKKLILVFRY